MAHTKLNLPALPPDIFAPKKVGINGNSNNEISNMNNNMISDKKHEIITPNKGYNNISANNDNICVNSIISNYENDYKSKYLLKNNTHLYGTLKIQNLSNIINKLISYGFTSVYDIAKLTPWQLRVLKKEISRIDSIFMITFKIYGNPSYYNYNEITPNIWLELNEIELVLRGFDPKIRGYKCFMCHYHSKLESIDELRWHLYINHRHILLHYLKSNNNTNNWEDSKSNIIEINDDSDDDSDITSSTKAIKYDDELLETVHEPKIERNINLESINYDKLYNNYSLYNPMISPNNFEYSFNNTNTFHAGSKRNLSQIYM